MVWVICWGCPAISIHALREEGDLPPWIQTDRAREFLSTPSARRATGPHEGTGIIQEISIHALREEGDASRSWFWPSRVNFYPRPPRGGRLTVSPIPAIFPVFLSTPSARRATPVQRGGSRASGGFLSTPSARRATNQCIGAAQILQFLSTPSARRATRGRAEKLRAEAISIHALREEGDSIHRAGSRCCHQFLSTPSARRATVRRVCIQQDLPDFYPRPPRGGRRYAGSAFPRRSPKFLSTPSARRATSTLRRRQGRQKISIHALREEGDL